VLDALDIGDGYGTRGSAPTALLRCCDGNELKQARQITLRFGQRHALRLERFLACTAARKAKKMKKLVAWSILLALGHFNSTSRAQSQNDTAKQFAGMWRLVSNPQRLTDGTTREGSNSVGYAFFDANAGRMCFLSMNPKRPQWKSESTPTGEEGLSAIKGFGAYCATIEIHANEGFMVRRYEINQTPKRSGQSDQEMVYLPRD
jgi:hypothetical protein